MSTFRGVPVNSLATRLSAMVALLLLSTALPASPLSPPATQWYDGETSTVTSIPVENTSGAADDVLIDSRASLRYFSLSQSGPLATVDAQRAPANHAGLNADPSLLDHQGFMLAIMVIATFLLVAIVRIGSHHRSNPNEKRRSLIYD